MPPFLHFLFQIAPAAPPSDLTVNVIVSISSIALATGVNWLASSKAAGRMEGANAQRFIAIDKRLDSHATELDQVWSKVGEHTKDIGELRGEMNAGKSKAKGHHN